MVADGPDCDKGYYCVGGALNRRPSDLATYNGLMCVPGSWCGAGTGASGWTNCLKGTYSSANGLTEASECTTCPNGFMCPTDGMTESDFDTASNQCDQGYYCGAGIDGVSTTKQECDLGRYCPANSMEQLPCDSGYYQD